MPAPTALELLGPIGILLIVGGVVGHSDDLIRRLPGFDRDAAKTWTMRVSLGCATVAAAALIGVVVRHLVGCTATGAPGCAQTMRAVALPSPIPGLDPDLTLRIDGMAALFLLVVAFCGGCIAVYSFGWLADNRLRHSVAGSFCLFLFATALTILVNNAFWLFVALELMTLCSADLVRYSGRIGGTVAASRTAVNTYLLVNHVGLMCLMAGLLPILVEHSQLDFDALRAAGGSSVPVVPFGLVLLGLAVRAGVTPFHFWVPTVHPHLPTNTHAMMSAVMLKIPVYLMIRFFFEEIIGPITWWWGAVLLVLAGITAVVTVFYALLSSDLKVALAYHSVENIGIILAGLGLALVFSDGRFGQGPAIRGAAAVALLASLYHVVNHALFKSLLFLGAGSIERQVGTVLLSRLGGLIRTLPWTALTFLIGAAAIAGLPPLNGFVSEWLTLQAMFGSKGVYTRGAPVALFIMAAFVIALVTLALAFATTALAFAKITGEALLGEPRGTGRPGPEAWSMRGVLVLLAALCLVLGLQPWLLVPWLSAAITPMGYDISGLTATPTTLAVDLSDSADVDYHASVPVLPLLVLVGLPVVLTVLVRAWRWTRRPVWAGGKPFSAETMQYTGSALSALLWEPVSRPSSVAQASGEEDPEPAASTRSPAAPLPVSVQLSTRRRVVDLANHLYNELVRCVATVSEAFGNRVQGGDIRRYLLYIFVTGIVVLAVLAVIP